jgi:heme-degrading monooxygenase HmoA
MVLEHAVIDVRPGTGAHFEEAVAEARSIIAASHGFISLQLHRGIEAPDRYLLLVEWETLDDHVVGFRQSDAFARWRGLIGPYFASPPVVDHLWPVDAVGPAPTVGQEVA